MRILLLVALLFGNVSLASDDPCAIAKETRQLGNRTAPTEFPARGKVVTECHYVTTIDGFGLAWPAHTRDRIAPHLERSCNALRQKFGWKLSPSCNEIYLNAGSGCWTPAEGSRVGQAAIGVKLPPEGELWLGTMYWAPGTRPKPGTRWIAKSVRQNRALVIAMGYEHGPRNPKWIAGMSPEATYYLGSEVILGRAVDQSLLFGPVLCKPEWAK